MTGTERNGELTREKTGASSPCTALMMARSRGFYYRDLWEGRLRGVTWLLWLLCLAQAGASSSLFCFYLSDSVYFSHLFVSPLKYAASHLLLPVSAVTSQVKPATSLALLFIQGTLRDQRPWLGSFGHRGDKTDFVHLCSPLNLFINYYLL